MESTTSRLSTLTKHIQTLDKKINLLLSKTSNEVDLSQIEGQIQEILAKLDTIDIDSVIALIDGVNDDIDSLKIQLNALVKRVTALEQLVDGLDFSQWEDLLQFIKDNKTELLELFKALRKIKEIGFTWEMADFYVEQYPNIKYLLKALSDNETNIQQLSQQIKFMKEYMIIQQIGDSYYDIINNTDPIIHPSILEFSTTEYINMVDEYRKLPSLDTEVEDIRYPKFGCLLIEINRNTVLTSQNEYIYSQTTGQFTLEILESEGKLTYRFNHNGVITEKTIDNFQIVGTDQLTELPNYKSHFLIFRLTNVLKKIYSISIMTGNLDVEKMEISIFDTPFVDELPISTFVGLTAYFPFQTTFYTTVDDSVFDTYFDIFKNMYIAAVLENIAYKTEQVFNELYTNQIINNLYGQSTAISVSKIMSMIGRVPRVREVEYTLESSSVETSAGAYIHEVTSWIDTQQYVSPILCQPDPIHHNLRPHVFKPNMIKFSTLLSQNGRLFANSSRKVFEQQRKTFEVKQVYDDSVRTIKAWMEEEWVSPKYVTSQVYNSVMLDSNSNPLPLSPTADNVCFSFVTSDNSDYGPVIEAMRVSGISDTIKSGNIGCALKIITEASKKLYLYILPGNLSSESNQPIRGIIEINNVAYDVTLTPYIYENYNATTSVVYRGLVTNTPVTRTNGLYLTALYDTIPVTNTNNTVTTHWNGSHETEYTTNLLYPARPDSSTSGLLAPGKVDGLDITFKFWSGAASIHPSYGMYVYNNIVSPAAGLPLNRYTSNLEAYPNEMVSWHGRYNWHVLHGWDDDLNIYESTLIYQVPVGRNDIKYLTSDAHGTEWTLKQTTAESITLAGAVTITPPDCISYTDQTPYTITNLILTGHELSLPVSFDQIAIPDYIVNIKNDVAYLSAYAEYLKSLIDDLDRRTTLVEETLEEVIDTINNIIEAITPKPRSLGGQILSFCGSAIGMFFPLCGLAISIVGQVYEGVVQLKRGNILTGVLDITTGSLMTILGVRKFSQRMSRKYGTQALIKNDGLPSYDELFGPPGYGSSSVRQDLYLGRRNDSPVIKSGTLRNTMILNQSDTKLEMETWLYRTNYGYQSEVRKKTTNDKLSSRAIRITETWSNKQLQSIKYTYSEVSFNQLDQVVVDLSNEIFMSDYQTKFSIEQFGKMLFAKTRKSIVDADGFGFDNEVFQVFMLSMSNATIQQSRRFKIKSPFKIIDRTLIPFRKRNITPEDDLVTGVSINHFYTALDSNLCNESSQELIYNSVFQMLSNHVTTIKR